MQRNIVLRRLPSFGLLALAGVSLSGCDDTSLTPVSTRSQTPIPALTVTAMEAMGSSKNSPVLIRTYKKEAELEIWKMKSDGHYALFKTYPMCRWSGQLGPKVKEGDRQVPEGFYSIPPSHMNPNSAYYLSFDVGYPNAYDRALGHTGGSIMVHGVCSSAGCFSMTDGQIAEIYAIAREAFASGQRTIQLQSYPFHMTAENLAKYRLDPNIGFWKQLKEGADNFEVTKQDVSIGVCGKHYVFNASTADGSRLDPAAACPSLKYDNKTQAEVAARGQRDEAKAAELAAGGLKPIRTVYADGGQHPHFASYASYASRPEALAKGPIDVALKEDKPKKSKLASASAAAQRKPAGVTSAAAAETPATSSSDAITVAAAAAEPAKTESSWLDNLWGKKSETKEPAAEAAPSPPPAQPVADVPLPPKRNEASSGPARRDPATSKPEKAVAAPAPVKPEASLEERRRTASAEGLRGTLSALSEADR